MISKNRLFVKYCFDKFLLKIKMINGTINACLRDVFRGYFNAENRHFYINLSSSLNLFLF